MSIVGRVAGALRQLFGPLAEEAARASGVVVRRRVFTALSLAQTFVLGFLRKPDASDEELAQMAAACGAPVTPQAVDQRQTPKLVAFLEELFRRAVTVVVGSDRALAPILERFVEVRVLDSSTITLPDGQRERFPGCGGSYDSGVAALKLQTEIDLRAGTLAHVEIESGRSADSATSRQHVRRAEGSLRVTDLGYFCLAVFAAMVAAGEYFLSRLQFGVKVYLPDGTAVDVLSWLSGQAGPFVDRAVALGLEERLACRLIAWRVPAERANRRRQKLRDQHRRKWNKEPSAERLAWCEWTILVTSVPENMLSPREAVVVYRARWQVELLFKRWKSQGQVAAWSGSTEARQMTRVWARLLAMVVQHWLMVATAWGDPTKSLVKVCAAIRSFVMRLVDGSGSSDGLERALTGLTQVIAKTCKRNPRSTPGTFELLNDVKRLDYRLT